MTLAHAAAAASPALLQPLPTTTTTPSANDYSAWARWERVRRCLLQRCEAGAAARPAQAACTMCVYCTLFVCVQRRRCLSRVQIMHCRLAKALLLFASQLHALRGGLSVLARVFGAQLGVPAAA